LISYPPCTDTHAVHPLPTRRSSDLEKAAATIAGQVNLVPAEGLDVQLWASEKLLGDPVAISVDNQGRLWATVTNRSNNSEFDIQDRKSTRLNSSHVKISYAVFCLKK